MLGVEGASRVKLLEMVPRLPPSVDGIGDHALRLAERLRTGHGIETHFLVGYPGWEGPTEIDGFPVTRLAARNPAALCAAFESCLASSAGPESKVLLQFAPYGYEIRGCPVWLIQGLRDWTREHPGSLMTMFHELDADQEGPMNSAFWLSPLQRLLIRQLAGMTAFRFTNTEIHRRKLGGWRIGEVALLPSFSTVGEPAANRPVADRKRQMVVFGRAFQRELTYSKGGEALIRACRLAGAERIVDIGQPLGSYAPLDKLGIPYERAGRLPSEEVSAWMESSIASFIYYPNAFLTKSSTYAASCAHGTIPFVASDCGAALKATELTPGADYIAMDDGEAATGDLQKLSDEIYARYRLRGSEAAAEQIACALLGRSR